MSHTNCFTRTDLRLSSGSLATDSKSVVRSTIKMSISPLPAGKKVIICAFLASRSEFSTQSSASLTTISYVGLHKAHNNLSK